MSLVPPVTPKTRLHKMETSWYKTVGSQRKKTIQHPTSLRSLTAAPDASRVNHLSSSAQLWITLICLKVLQTSFTPRPTPVFECWGKQQLGSAVKVGCTQRSQRGWSEESQPWWVKKKKKKGRRQKWEKEGAAEGILCSVSVSCAWQTTWKQFIFFPKTF